VLPTGPFPAGALDAGGASGVYAAWLASRGYTVRLIDPVPLHIQQATQNRGLTAAFWDARSLKEPVGPFDAVPSAC
jgi:2-polyprenyl-3-methyl-5-hydroxy-6-metoxy-1,4-benzoquinol methylase